jgi:hypothetical protein
MELGAPVKNKNSRQRESTTDRKTTGETNNNEPTTTGAVGRHHDGATRYSGASKGAVGFGNNTKQEEPP